MEATPTTTAAAAVPASVRLPRNVIALGTAEFAGRLLAFLSTIIVARVLGPELFGPVTIALALVLYLGALGDGGLTLWTQRQIVLRPNDLSPLVAGTMVVQLLLSAAIVAVIVAVALAIPFPGDTAILLLVLAPYAVVAALNTIYALQALEHMVAVAAVRVLTQLVTAVVAISLVVATEDPVWFALALWLGLLVGDLTALVLLRRVHMVRLLDMFAVRRAQVLNLLRHGAPFLGIIALLFFVVSVDVVMLGAFDSSEEVGEYGAVRRLIATPLQIIQVMLIAVFPEMVRRFAEDRAGFAPLVHTLVRLAVRPTIAAAVFVMVEAGPIVELLLGPDYKDSTTILSITVLLIPAFWFYGLVGYSLLAAGRQKAFLAILAGTAAAAAAAYPLAIIPFGAVGAAVAVTVALCVQAGCFALYGHRHLGLRAVSAVAWELPYGTVPLGALILLHVALPDPSLALAFVVWALATLGIEFANGMPTLRGVRELAGPVLARGGGAPAPG